MKAQTLKIGDLARQTGTKVVTIRYYEKAGLLPEPDRTEANYRSYDRATLERLNFIRSSRGLGFSLEQIRGLLDLSARAERPCAEVDRMAATHLAEVEKKIAELEQMAAKLRRTLRACGGEGTISDCRVIGGIAE